MPKNPNLDKLRALRANPGHADVRSLHIAYCLLRGRKIAQIESPNSNPYVFPDLATIRQYVLLGHRPTVENPHDPEYMKAEHAFWNEVEAELKAWKKQLHLNWLELDAKKRARNYAKRNRLAARGA